MEAPGRTLNDVSNDSRDSSQHLGESHSSDLWYYVRSVEGGGPEACGHVEDVGGGELEVDEGGVQLGDDGGKEIVLRLVTELQNCRQDFFRAVSWRSPVLTT